VQIWLHIPHTGLNSYTCSPSPNRIEMRFSWFGFTDWES